MKFQSGKSSEGDFQVYMYGYPNESNHDLHVHMYMYRDSGSSHGWFLGLE